MSIILEANQKNLFIKRPKILYANNEYKIKLVPRILFKEAEVLEFLK
jgi:hypothetical protein